MRIRGRISMRPRSASRGNSKHRSASSRPTRDERREVTMAPRATWKGYLKLSLVSCPVRLYPAATESNRIAFHLLHKETHNRIRMQPRDPDLGDVDRADLVKGYEYEKDKYVILTDEDFAKVRIEST